MGHLNGQNSRDDGDVDASGFAVSDVLEEVLGLEEKLSDDEVRTGLDFLLQMKQIIFVGFGVWMTLRG